jgi:hypothetical protein
MLHSAKPERLDERERSSYQRDNTCHKATTITSRRMSTTTTTALLTTTAECNIAARVRRVAKAVSEKTATTKTRVVGLETQREPARFHPLPHTPLHLRA